MQPQKSPESSRTPRQPLGDRTNEREALAPVPPPPQTARPPRSLPPPEVVRLHGRILGGRDSIDCLQVGRFVRLVQWEGTLVVVKHGTDVSSAEADVMRLVRANTAIPVPEVLDVVKEADETYLYLEFVDGKTLGEAWPSLSAAEVAHIKLSFAKYVSQLAALRPPDSTPLGTLRPHYLYQLSDPCRTTYSRKPEPVVQSVEDFRRWIRFEIDRRRQQLVGQRIPSDIEGVLADGDVCLVHADLHAENILIKNGRIAAILDWGMASWLPHAVEAYSMVSYISEARLGPGSALAALLETFNLDSEVLEAYKVLYTVLSACPDREYR